MDELTQDQKDALERFKTTKDDPETIAGFFYRLLEQADPRLKEVMDHKAAVLMNAGYKLGEEIAEAEKDPAKKEKMVRNMRKVANSINSSVRAKASKDKVEESK